jgi:hypothetical protein
MMGEWWKDQTGEEFIAGYGTGGPAPQYVALRLDRGAYLRLNCGPGTSWGTSAALLPIPWLRGANGADHLGQILQWDAWQEEEDLVIKFQGSSSGLDSDGTARIALAGNYAVMAYVAVRTSGTLDLEPLRADQAFKYAFLSSMKVSDQEWDAAAAYVGGRLYPIPSQDPDAIIVPLGTPGNRFGVLGGESHWQSGKGTGPVPGVEVFSQKPMACGGFLTRKIEEKGNETVVRWRTVNHDDDNVGVWASSPYVLSEWSYVLVYQV